MQQFERSMQLVRRKAHPNEPAQTGSENPKSETEVALEKETDTGTESEKDKADEKIKQDAETAKETGVPNQAPPAPKVVPDTSELQLKGESATSAKSKTTKKHTQQLAETVLELAHGQQLMVVSAAGGEGDDDKPSKPDGDVTPSLPKYDRHSMRNVLEESGQSVWAEGFALEDPPVEALEYNSGVWIGNPRP